MRIWRATNRFTGEYRECATLSGLFSSITCSILFYERNNYPNWAFKGYNKKEDATL